MNRSVRTKKPTQRLLDSGLCINATNNSTMKPSWSLCPMFPIKEEVAELTFSKKTTTAEALQHTLENISDKLDNYEIKVMSEYTIEDIQVLDGSSLLKLFAAFGISKDGVYQYRCQLSPHDCDRVFSGKEQKQCKKDMIVHLSDHVEVYKEKLLKNPSFYKKKRLKPFRVNIKLEPDFSDYNDQVEPPIKKRNIFTPSQSKLTLSSFLQREICNLGDNNLVDQNGHLALVQGVFPNSETSPSEINSKEALLSAVSLKSRTNLDSSLSNLKARVINTRLGRKKLVQQCSLLKQQEKLRKHFRNQPKVVLRPMEFKKAKRIENGSDSSEDDDSELATSDSEDERLKKGPLKIVARKKSLMSSLRKRKQVRKRISSLRMIGKQRKKSHMKEKSYENEIVIKNKVEKSSKGNPEEIKQRDAVPPVPFSPVKEEKSFPQCNALISVPKTTLSSCLRQRYVPPILRRKKLFPSMTSDDGIANIKIEDCVSLASEETPSSLLIDGVQEMPVTKHATTDSTLIEEDIDVVSLLGSNRSSEASEREDSKAPYADDDISEKSVWSDGEEKNSIPDITSKKKSPRKQNLHVTKDDLPYVPSMKQKIAGVLNDHDYTNLKHDKCITDFSHNFTKGFVKLTTQALERKSFAVKGKAMINIRSLCGSNPSIKSGEFKLQGPSSKKTEAATDPEVQAKALKLLAELRHRKPKEVMICTERVVNDESAYIVQDFYSCEICGKRFTAPNSLYGHYRGHAGIKPYKCNVCGKHFTRSHSLNYHSMIHTNSARFECKHCGRKFRHPTHYKEHLHRHTGEEPYKCSDCPRRFKTRNTYRRHMIAKHQKKITPAGSLPYNARIVSTIHT